MIIAVNPFSQESLILLESPILQIFDAHRQNSSLQTEAGGILLGYRRGTHLHVVRATIPQHADQRSRFSFHRISHEHQMIATDHWEKSAQTMDYIGEWHTHPEEQPQPSSIDVHAWKLISEKHKVPMIFAIAGQRDSIWLGIGLGSSLRATNRIFA